MNTIKLIYRNTIKVIALKIKYVLFKIKWRKRNSHNDTIAMNFFPVLDVEVGCNTYGELNVYKFNENSKIKIGHFCSIGQNSSFILDADHYINHISTYPYKAMMLHSVKFEAISKGNIIVDDDVWIGYGVTIMSGIHIGQGAVIAAGSVVTRNVPPYAIVGGVPAKVIKYRFEPEMIEELLKIDYSKLTDEIIKEHIDELYTELKDIKQLEWIPKKG